MEDKAPSDRGLIPLLGAARLFRQGEPDRARLDQRVKIVPQRVLRGRTTGVICSQYSMTFF